MAGNVAIPIDNFITKDTMKRIISDVKDIRKNPLASHGIYYEHDETDLLKGKALIIGTRDTPYADGFYLFKFAFPPNYPHAPPVVEFCTGDGNTRLNPNLYRSGKVCLSILNTWQGEPWSGCQTISSVLFAICTIFNDAPLLNEPGVTRAHRDFENYNAIIRYKNIAVAILGTLAAEKTQAEFGVFLPIMRDHFQRERDNIWQRLVSALPDTGKTISTSVYQLSVLIDYAGLIEKFSSV